MKFCIGALALQGAGIVDFVARIEERYVWSRSHDDARGIPAKDFPLTGFRTDSPADLGIERVDRDGFHCDKDVAPPRLGLRQVYVGERSLFR